MPTDEAREAREARPKPTDEAREARPKPTDEARDRDTLLDEELSALAEELCALAEELCALCQMIRNRARPHDQATNPSGATERCGEAADQARTALEHAVLRFLRDAMDDASCTLRRVEGLIWEHIHQPRPGPKGE